MKKTLLVFAALCCTTMANAVNQYAVKIGNIFYTLNSEKKVATVTWGGAYNTAGTPEYTGDIQIPASVESEGETYIVSHISDDAFCGCIGLTSVSLPKGMEFIGNSAFKDCTSLSSISLPEGLDFIAGNVFEGCTGLSSISLPEGLQSISSYAFKGCSGITSIAIPSTVKTIGSFAFDGTQLKEIFIYSDSLTSVEPKAWDYDIPTYVKAKSFKKYKANLLRSYNNVKVLPGDDSIGDAIKDDYNFSDEEAKVINELLSVRDTMGKKHAGPAVEVIQGDKKVILYNPDKVNFIKITTEE